MESCPEALWVAVRSFGVIWQRLADLKAWENVGGGERECDTNEDLLSKEKTTGAPPAAIDRIMRREGSMGVSNKFDGDDLSLHGVFRPLAI